MKQLIHAYIDHELTAEQRRAIEDHLASCAACRMYAARMQETRDMARSVPPTGAPSLLTTMIRGRLGLPGSPSSGWLSTLKFQHIEFSGIERLSSALLATPLTVALFICAALMVYSPDGIQNMTSFLSRSSASLGAYTPEERKNLENMYEFSPEVTTEEYICSGETMRVNSKSQPRITVAPVRMFAEYEFTDSRVNHLSVLTCVHSDGSTVVESISHEEKWVKDKIDDMLESSIIFPALVNGRMVDSMILFTFDKIEVNG
ncbi:MAG: zf-HC2 domain-containing protein [Acidobacteria bacterium]|nr:zf-HC2 domain-containing protein [Acidobacteriota bacterium]